MQNILNIRYVLLKFYKQYEVSINFILKFFAGMFIFTRINQLGLYREEFAVIFDSNMEFFARVAASVLFVIMPPSLALFLAVLAITIQLSAVLEVAIFVFALLTMVILFYARLAPRQSFIVPATVIGLHFNIPYLVLILAGLYFGPMAAIPVIIGVAIWYFLPFFSELALTTPIAEEFVWMDFPLDLMEVFVQIYAHLTSSFSWMMIGFVFAIVVLSASFISKIPLNYARELAILASGLVAIISMGMTVSALEVNITMLSVVGGAIVSMLAAYAIRFFDCVVDYRRVERVFFEDDDNLYYVKIVPKVGAVKDERDDEGEDTEAEHPRRVRKKTKKPPAKPDELPVIGAGATRSRSDKPTAASPRSSVKPEADPNAYRAKLKNRDLFDE